MTGAQMTEPPPSFFGGPNQLHGNWRWKNVTPNGFIPPPPPPVYHSWRNDQTQPPECVILDQDPHSFVPPTLPTAQMESTPQTFVRGVHYNSSPTSRKSVDETTPRLEPPPPPPNLALLKDDRFLYATGGSSRPNPSFVSRHEEHQPFATPSYPTTSQHSYVSTSSERLFFRNEQSIFESKRWENRQEKTPSPRRSPNRRKRSRSPDISEREPRERERRRSPHSFERNRMRRTEEKFSKNERRSNQDERRKSPNEEKSPEVNAKGRLLDKIKKSPESEGRKRSLERMSSESRSRSSHHRWSSDGASQSKKRSSSDRTSRDERKRKTEDFSASDRGKKKSRKSDVESELEAFARQHDPEALLEKLRQKKMDQIKNSLLEKMAERNNSVVEEESTGNSPLSEKDSVIDLKIEVENSVDESDEREESPATSDEIIEDNYPWYIGAPLQNQIHDVVFSTINDDLYAFDGRPQKQEEGDLYRSFPVKKRDLFSERVVELDFITQTKKIHTNRTEILRQDESGVVIRRGGSYSWVSRKIMPSAVPEGISQNNNLAEAPRSTSNSVTPTNLTGANDCFEFAETQNCAAGLLCKYDHNGNGDHRKVKFCKRFMNGLCRNDDNCSNGSHALQKHQMPVCDYYLRRKCYFFQEQCPYLHVKTSASTPLCIHFNKGKCQSQQPCNYSHRYSPSVIRERCNDVSDDPADNDTRTRFEDLAPLEWYT